MSATDKAKTISRDVLFVLNDGRCDGAKFFLPPRTLERKLYSDVNEVLVALGGKWNRKAGAHVFDEPCYALIENAVDTGTFVRPGDMGWFPTQPPIVEIVIDEARISEGMLVLEPEVGEGAIALAAAAQGAIITAYEIDARRAGKAEKALGTPVGIRDFLTVVPEPVFDRVVMNPPFAQRADVKHVLHAMKFLTPGGRLVAIMSAGVLFRTDALTVSLRSQLSSMQELPEGAFKASGTNVSTVLVTYTRS